MRSRPLHHFAASLRAFLTPWPVGRLPRRLGGPPAALAERGLARADRARPCGATRCRKMRRRRTRLLPSVQKLRLACDFPMTFLITFPAAQVHIGYRVTRAFDGPDATCAQRQQHRLPICGLLATKDDVCRPATLMNRRGVPLDARSTPTLPAAALTHRIASARWTPAAADYCRGLAFAATRFVSRAGQVADGRAVVGAGHRADQRAPASARTRHQRNAVRRARS